MKARPILFSGPMVRALLDGRKTQTRRIYKGEERKPERGLVWRDCLCREIDPSDTPCVVCHRRFGDCPYGAPGDVLWVRETWRAVERASDMHDGILFAADGAFVGIENTSEAADLWVDAYDNGKHGDHWRPSIFLPKWAPRLFLRVESVRVERLHDISPSDVMREGIELDGSRGARLQWADLWRSINGAESWDANPWVWVVSFSRIERPAGWPVTP